jgi:hypothetical protein
MMKDGPRLARWAAYGAAVAAFGYAVVSLYWAAGGTAGLNTVGGVAEKMARSGGAAAVAVIAATVLLKTLGGLLALAMVRPWGQRLPGRGVGIAGLAGSAVLILYGAAEVTGEALAETGAIRPSASADWTALRWHLGLWDPWFLAWGLLLAIATWGYRPPRVRLTLRDRRSARPGAHPRRYGRPSRRVHGRSRCTRTGRSARAWQGRPTLDRADERKRLPPAC